MGSNGAVFEIAILATVLCFTHSDRQAVGLCKSCNKGLCHDCATDLGDGLACKGAHEENVTRLNSLIAKNLRVQAATPKNTWAILPVFLAFIGLVFAVFGITTEGIGGFLVITGSGFILFSIVSFILNRKAFGSLKSLP